MLNPFRRIPAGSRLASPGAPAPADAFIRQLLTLSPGYQWEAQYLAHLRTRFVELELLGSFPNTPVTGDAAQDFATVLEILLPGFRQEVLGVVQAAYAYARTSPPSGGGTTQERYRQVGQGGPPVVAGLSFPVTSTPTSDLSPTAGPPLLLSMGEDSSGRTEERHGKPRGKPGEKSVYDLDDNEWTSSVTTGFGEKVATAQGLLRVLNPELKQAFLGHSLRIDVKSIMATLREWYLMLLAKQPVDVECNHISQLGAVQELTVMENPATLENFWLFKWSWANPTVLSLAHMLPRSSSFSYWSLDMTDTGRGYLSTSLGNLERVLYVLFRVPATDVTRQFRDMLADGRRVNHVPDAMLFNWANMAVARVFENFRKGVPRVPKDYCGADRLAHHIRAALGTACKAIEECTSIDIERFKTVTYREVTWPAEGRVSRKRTAEEYSEDARGNHDDDDACERASKQPYNTQALEESDSGIDGIGYDDDEDAQGEEMQQISPQRGSNGSSAPLTDGEGGGFRGAATVICAFRLAEILGVADPVRPANLMRCKFGPACRKGSHIFSLKDVRRDEAWRSVESYDNGFDHQRRRAVTAAIESAPPGSFKDS
jgi:hypothetical protein